jgi:ribonucleoside-diphosphate reductase alpha chain
MISSPILGQLNVIKRNGTTNIYDDAKIKIAITKAFLAVQGDSAAVSDRIHEVVNQLTQQITSAFLQRWPAGANIHIEDIQDRVEIALMRSQEYEVATAYVLYRDQRRREREQNESQGDFKKPELTVILHDGSRKPLDLAYLRSIIDRACIKLSGVDPDYVLQETLRNLFDGVPIQEVNKALQLTAKMLIEKEPNYSFVAARLLLHDIREQALEFLKN